MLPRKLLDLIVHGLYFLDEQCLFNQVYTPCTCVIANKLQIINI